MNQTILKQLKLAFALFFIELICLQVSANQNAITVRDLSVAPGSKGIANITIKAPQGDTFVPITIVNGTNSGPTLLVLAGIHGSEYSPILATQNLAPALNPKNISGAVIFVHIANMPSYLGRSIYTSPLDNQNLNRVFPGKEDGFITERIAHFLTAELYPLADAVLDMHSGDGNEQLRPFWTGYYGQAGSNDTITASREMAYAFGLEYIVEFQWQFTEVKDAIWAGSAAVAQGIPSIDIEAGGMGTFDEAAIKKIEEGVHRVMAHMSMTHATFPQLPSPKTIKERKSIKAPKDGSWVPLIDAGKIVNKGDLIGYMTDWQGNRIFEALAPMDGLLLMRFEAPPAIEGDTLAVVGQVE